MEIEPQKIAVIRDTKLALNSPKSESLKTTIPMDVKKEMNLENGDTVYWLLIQIGKETGAIMLNKKGSQLLKPSQGLLNRLMLWKT